MPRSILEAALLAAFAITTTTVSAGSPSPCCSLLSDLYPSQITFPGTPEYQAAQDLYYSSQQRDYLPSCRVAPSTSQQVSNIVQLASSHSCFFEVRSGGHVMQPGGSNADSEGFTIDLHQLNHLELSEDEKNVRVGPGLKWEKVFGPLMQKNLTVVGGRDPGVGVGGYLIGGGISFMSYEHGLGADNILEYELVTGTGAILHVNEQSYPDLHFAMKLGSTNYGIVTSFTLPTFPIGPIYSGMQFFEPTEDNSVTLFRQFTDYVDMAAENPKDAAFTHVLYLDVGGQTYINMLAMAFKGAEVKPPLYQKLIGDVKALEDKMEVTDLMGALNHIRDDTKFRTVAFSRTLRLDRTGRFHYENFLKAKEIWQKESRASITDLTWVTGVQPFPKNYFRANSPLSHHHDDDENLMLLVIKVSWSLPSEDALVLDAMSQWLDWVESTASERGILHPFIFMNYADTSQPVYANNVKPETLAVMKKTQARYDPEGVFTNLLRGGFKLPPFCDSEEQAPASFLVQDGYENLLGRELLSRNVTQSMKKTECTLRYMSQVDS